MDASSGGFSKIVTMPVLLTIKDESVECDVAYSPEVMETEELCRRLRNFASTFEFRFAEQCWVSEPGALLKTIDDADKSRLIAAQLNIKL